MRLLAGRLALLAAGISLAGCSEQPSPPTVSSLSAAVQQQQPSIQKISAPHLPNAYRLHEKVISGGMPEGDAAFSELKELGVKTIISVDGVKPDVATARKFGLRYVHLPHGYDGISEKRAAQLAKAVRDLDGPIYIHCHHGKHRSPAAATVACVGAGYLSPSNALMVLKTAGTSDHYRGLYASADEAQRIDDQLLDALEVEFRETADLPPMAECMVEIERSLDRLKRIAKAGWRPPAEHPDLDPPHEALMLREHFMELPRTADVKTRSEPFQEFLKESLAATEALENALRTEEQEGDGATRKNDADRALERIARNCTACHQQFRDVPQSGTSLP